MTTSRVEREIKPSTTRSWSALGSLKIVGSVVTTGIRSSRKKRGNMTTGGPAEDSKLVLKAHHVHVADIEEARGPRIGRQILFLHLEAHDVGIFVSIRNVIDRHRSGSGFPSATLDGSKQI